MNTSYRAASRPTLYFIGVSTKQSSIMKIFPRWADFLGISGTVIQGIDFPLDAPATAYREVIEFLKQDPLSLGALVTTHKIGLFKACRDLFEEIDPFAQFMGEASSLSKDQGKLIAHAKDPISSGLALEAFLPSDYWKNNEAEVLVLGAGGAAIAITWYLSQQNHGSNRPARIIITDREEKRLKEIQKIHSKTDQKIDYRLVTSASVNDEILGRMKPGSLVINATGLGKDAPGSPLSDVVKFPESGIVWELNYRGELPFLKQARAQASEKQLKIEDGWIYFIHGWTQVIAEVFHIKIPTSGAYFDQLSAIASEIGKPPI